MIIGDSMKTLNKYFMIVLGVIVVLTAVSSHIFTNVPSLYQIAMNYMFSISVIILLIELLVYVFKKIIKGELYEENKPSKKRKNK